MENKIVIRSEHLTGSEVSWFAPICDGDDRYLGERSMEYKSSWENTSDILLTADKLGFRNILCPSSYQVGQDTLPFVSAVAPMTENINLLAAIRCGEVHPPMLARTLATIDHILKGRLTINIISSNLPGEDLSSEDRYQRSREVIQILKQAWTQEEIDFKGKFYNLKLPTNPVKPYQNGGPMLYFGGYSPSAVELCAEHCDVYLMWPETEENLRGLMQNMSDKAATYNRKVDFGLRVHVVVRETEEEARAYADSILSKLDIDKGTEIRERALDAKSYGVSRQKEMREQSKDDGYVEPHLWTGIGKARSGCGAALVGNPEQIIAKLNRYMDMGIRSFILSGYPHKQECEYFAKLVLPHLKTVSLLKEQGKVGDTAPLTPLAAGKRI
ncbi:LLM class flavin-dependent oxidoreductase [Croceivirga sp. JEA036]|uniref:LLM class flavin-dependent oxidoreductase n=1 Tax=Croceivirga sp. JEA036 TaxID=2721162 RepID=UPI00143C5396|nr:LLM class flavin-dependent oxidoreductase [Croceivirga sp. JEA036]NJB36482.1 LLM class flavin-dependent oxidoreductase [Croceivirga sp. JEA036]